MDDKNQQKSTRAETADNTSSDVALTRKEFIKRTLRGAAAAGAVIAAPAILDKFLIPPVYAIGTRMSAAGSASDQPSGYGTDTSIANPLM